MTEISPEATLSATNVACKTWTDSTLIRLGSRSICLGLEVSELGADRTLHLIDLGSELFGGGGQFQLLVDLIGDACECRW